MPGKVGWFKADMCRVKVNKDFGFHASTQPTKNAWKSRLGLDRYGSVKLNIFVGFRASTQPTKNAGKSRLGLDRYFFGFRTSTQPTQNRDIFFGFRTSTQPTKIISRLGFSW